MKVSNTGHVFEVGLNPLERKIFGEDERLLIQIDPRSDDKWVQVSESPKGNIVGKRTDSSHPFRVYKLIRDIPIFGTEEVKSHSPGKGILFGHRPKMIRQPFKKGPRPKSEQVQVEKTAANGLFTGAEASSMLHIKQAVILINNFKTQHPEDVEITVEGGVLKVRFMMEF